MKNKEHTFDFLNILIWFIMLIISSYIFTKSTIFFNIKENINNIINLTIKQIILDTLSNNINIIKYYNNNSDNLLSLNFPVIKYCYNEQENNIEVVTATNTNYLNEYTNKALTENNDFISSEISSIDKIQEENQNFSNNLNNYNNNSTLNNTIENISDSAIENNDLIDYDKNLCETNNDSEPETSTVSSIYTLEQLNNYDFLFNNFFMTDNMDIVTKELFNASNFLDTDLSLTTTNEQYQILIYHSHSSEAFIDSRENNIDDTVVGVGSKLAQILEDDYNFNVYHDTSCYDVVNGELDRNYAYTASKNSIEKILKKYPSIEVIIDLHRDSSPRSVVEINNKQNAKMMIVNGMSRNSKGNIDYLYNPYLEQNLAFSFQFELKSMELFPDFMKKIYLKEYRYNLHFREKSILIELGTVYNTVEEVKNSTEPLAKILSEILK